MTHNHKVAYLTFDDGPNQSTKLLLNTLLHYKAKATFFMLEPQIRLFRKAARRIVREGHAVGLHGVTHDTRRFYASKRSVLYEFNKTRKTLKRITGRDTVLVRPPFGSVPYMKPSYLSAVKQAGYRLWDWNVDSLDWKYRDERWVRSVKRQVLNVDKLGKCPVILMHDIPETARLLPQVLNFLKQRGYAFKVLTPKLKPVRIQQTAIVKESPLENH